MRMPRTVANNPQEIIPVLHGAAHFHWHLNREVKDAIVDTSIDIECKRPSYPQVITILRERQI